MHFVYNVSIIRQVKYKLTLVICVKLGFEFFHLPLVSEQSSLLLQRAHAILLLVLPLLLDQRILLVVCDS